MTRGFLSDREIQNSDLVDRTLELRRESERAWLVSDGDKEIWLPKSQVERAGDVFTMPEWLAVQRGLV